MTVETLLTRLRELAQAFPRPGCDWESRPVFLPPEDRAHVAAVLAELGEPLPADFLEFLRLSGGVVARSVHNGYQLCGADMICTDDWPPNRIAGTNGEEHVVTVAYDGGGNAFLLSPSTQLVWRWDHEAGGVRQVAASFTEFLERIAADWEAYVTDQPRKFFV
jgi:hypothetical protein